MADEARRIEQAAEALLRWFEQQHPAERDDRVPIDALVAEIGLDVARFNTAMHPGTLGYLEPGEELIFLRAGLPEAVRRFTLAHELGHAVLHRNDGLAAQRAGTWVTEATADEEDYESTCGDDDLTEALESSGAEGELLGIGQAYSARARREGEANAFAAALLLPAERLRSAIATLRATEGKRDIPRRLAKQFGVSEEVLLRRLCALLAAPSPVQPTTEAEPATSSANSLQARALDDDQQAAVTAETPALIIAGPGSGKTTTLVARVAHLVQERGIPAERILALTFSRKAAREMRERLDILLAADDASASETHGPLARPQGPMVSTIHAFCGDLLRRYAPLVGLRPDFHLIGDAEGYFLMRRAANTLALEHYLPLTAPTLYFPDLLRAISRAKDSLIEPEEYAAATQAMLDCAQTPEDRLAAERSQEMATVYAAYQRALAAQGDADFGDLVRLCVHLFREHPDVLAAVQQRFSAVLVDEFQDINRAMGVLLRLLTEEDGALWAVGDADQAIYRFRGASPANLARFTEEYRGAYVHRLSGNYRSRPNILRAADSVAAALLPAEDRAPLRAIRPADHPQQVTLATAADETVERAGIVTAILARREAGYAWRDQAILCRTRRQVRAFVEALEQADIPTRVAAPLLDQPMLRDVLAVISLLSDASGAGMLRAGDLPGHRFSRDEARKALAVAHSKRHTARTLLISHLDTVKGLSLAGRRGLRALGKTLADLRTAPDIATGLARYFFALTNLGFTLMAEAEAGNADARAYAAALNHLMTLARLFDDTQRAEERVAEHAEDDEMADEKPASADWSGFLEYVRVLLGTPQGRTGAEDEPLAGMVDAVSVLTAHASKGLEFPVVYVPGLANGRFPAQRQWERVKAPTLESESPSDAAHDEEETCLFYVAITRARDELILSRPERLGRRQARPAPFLAPIERGLGDDLLRLEWRAMREHEQQTITQPPDDGHISERVAQTAEEPLSIAAIETYARCPRQYAYRYIEGLESSDSSLTLMRRGVIEALRLLHEPAEGDPAAASPTLADALTRFDEVWSANAAPAQEQEQPNEDTPRERPFGEVYRRYGHGIVQRAWQETIDRTESDGKAATAVGFEEAVQIPLGRRTITLTVDRVEQTPVPVPAGHAAVENTASNGQLHPNPSPTRIGAFGPTRYIRDRLGAASERPDLRALLYTLAAEQQAAPGAPVEVSQRNMTTGEREPVILKQRQRENLQDELTAAIEGMLRSDYSPHPEPHRCQSCPFLLICPG